MQTYANNALGSNELDQLILNRALGVTLTIGLEVSQITYVTLSVGWRAVFLSVWID